MGIEYFGEIEIEEGKSIHGKLLSLMSIHAQLTYSPMPQSLPYRQGDLSRPRHSTWRGRWSRLQDWGTPGMVRLLVDRETSATSDIHEAVYE
jgi:hypothetical protein